MPEQAQEKYQVRLDAFEGPMELLLHLIQVNKIDIYDIPIAALTEQYMAYLSEMRRFDIEVASEFLVMAATLLLIKSRMMLPKAPKEAEEEEEDDPREELVRRIVEITGKNILLEQGNSKPVSVFVQNLPFERALRHLAESAELQYDDDDGVGTIKKASWNLGGKRLLETEDGKTAFEDLFSVGTRDELVATFLALLELIRRRVVVVRQSALFGSIRVELRRTAGMPEAATAANEG